MSGNNVEIVSTAHWDGDPRLNRHLSYLESAGHQVSLSTHSDTPRLAALVAALRDIWRGTSRIVILPDPELFVLGSAAARLRRKLPIIDIHEDYPKAAMARPWVPDLLRPVVRSLAAINTTLGRAIAWRTMVAAPELKKSTDVVVLNLPDPALVEPLTYSGDKRLVYIGDLTTARGSQEMVEVLSHLDETFDLVLIGSASEEVKAGITTTATSLGVVSRVSMKGRLPHSEAWTAVGGALAGLSLLADVPAYREAVATKLWEYMAHGIPPVVSDLPGQRRIVSRLDEMLVCSSVEETAETLNTLAGNEERRQELGRRARWLVEQAWADHRPDLAVQAVVEP